MCNCFERFFRDSIRRLYPEQGWILPAASIGKRVRRRLEAHRFDSRMLDIQIPTPLQLLRISYAYARHEALEGLEIEAKAWAKAFFADCYFLDLTNAEGYFYLVFSPRYLLMALHLTLRECGKYVALRLKGDKSPLDTIQLCLASFYYDQSGEEVVA